VARVTCNGPEAELVVIRNVFSLTNRINRVTSLDRMKRQSSVYWDVHELPVDKLHDRLHGSNDGSRD